MGVVLEPLVNASNDQPVCTCTSPKYTLFSGFGTGRSGAAGADAGAAGGAAGGVGVVLGGDCEQPASSSPTTKAISRAQSFIDRVSGFVPGCSPIG
jgi:hypothetical protein